MSEPSDISPSSPPAKKRKLTHPSSIHKPFRSPLRPLSNTTNTAHAPAASPLRTSTLSHPTPPTPTSNLRPSFLLPSVHAHSTPHPVPTRHTLRHLQSEIRHLRDEIDLLQRAAALLPSGRSSKLADLTARWRRVARVAAEEVFEDAKRRVRDGLWEGGMRNEEKGEKGDGEFTMDMMLRLMNIDGKAVGYVPGEEGEGRWEV